MMQKTVRNLHAFDYRNDFTKPEPPQQEQADTITMTAQELAEVYSRARTEGEESADRRYEKLMSAKFDTASAQLEEAISHLLALADCLDAAHLSKETQSSARDLISAACRNIVDGQGDLFSNR